MAAWCRTTRFRRTSWYGASRFLDGVWRKLDGLRAPPHTPADVGGIGGRGRHREAGRALFFAASLCCEDNGLAPPHTDTRSPRSARPAARGGAGACRLAFSPATLVPARPVSAPARSRLPALAHAHGLR